MRNRLPLAGAVLALCLLGTHTTPAAAQAVAGSTEISLFSGWLFGERLTHHPLAGGVPHDPGTYPRLPDHDSYGVRLDHTFTRQWGLALSAEQIPAASRTRGGDARMRIRDGDLDVIWSFTPQSRVVGYTMMGAGYARARLERPISGLLEGEPATLGTRGTVTANVGIGARTYVNGHLLLRAEVRYRYLGRLIEPDGRGISTLQALVGAGWRF